MRTIFSTYFVNTVHVRVTKNEITFLTLKIRHNLWKNTLKISLYFYTKYQINIKYQPYFKLNLLDIKTLIIYKIYTVHKKFYKSTQNDLQK